MSLTTAYSLPLAAPLYPTPPPWRYRDCAMVVIPFLTEPGVTGGLVPEPLVPNADDLVLLMVGPMHNHALGSTREAFIAVPSTYGERAGNYAVFLYLENDACITSGREIWGWPKKAARFEFDEGEDAVRALVERDGTEIVRLGLELGPPARPQDLELNPTWFNAKVIPSVVEGARPEVMQLTATTFADVAVHEALTGTASLTFADGVADPLASLIPVRELLPGVYLRRFQLDLMLGEVIHDYLVEGPPEPLVVADALRA